MCVCIAHITYSLINNNFEIVNTNPRGLTAQIIDSENIMFIS